MIGIQMTSFVAIIGAAGLAVGWPYQERFRILPGVVILILKPFKVGDLLAQGYTELLKLAFFRC
jgi:small conductance mechanosensitive channel